MTSLLFFIEHVWFKVNRQQTSLKQGNPNVLSILFYEGLFQMFLIVLEYVFSVFLIGPQFPEWRPMLVYTMKIPTFTLMVLV